MIHHVTPSDDLQDVLDVTRDGDVIELQSGGVWRGNFWLPEGRKGLTIRCSEWQAFRSGERADIDAPFAMIEGLTNAAIQGGAYSSDIVLQGLEVFPGHDSHFTLLSFSMVATTDALINRLTIAHCYIHGHAGQPCQRGIAANARDVLIHDCVVDEIHHKAEAQAVAAWNTPGPITVRNCKLSASGMGFLSGGAESLLGSAGAPNEIVLERNYVTKPLDWIGTWPAKNAFEFKSGRKVLVRDNVIENTWVGADQPGALLVITPRDGHEIGDVLIENNLCRNAGVFLHASGTRNPDAGIKSITVRNNLVYEINSGLTGQKGRGALCLFGGSLVSRIGRVDLLRNTMIHGPDYSDPNNGNVAFGFSTSEKFIGSWFSDSNIYTSGKYLIHASGDGLGVEAVKSVTEDWKQSGSACLISDDDAANVPIGDFKSSLTPADIFHDPLNRDYRLTELDSVYRGCNAQEIMNMSTAIIAGVASPKTAILTWKPGVIGERQRVRLRLDGALIHNRDDYAMDVARVEIGGTWSGGQVLSATVETIGIGKTSPPAIAELTTPTATPDPDPPTDLRIELK